MQIHRVFHWSLLEPSRVDAYGALVGVRWPMAEEEPTPLALHPNQTLHGHELGDLLLGGGCTVYRVYSVRQVIGRSTEVNDGDECPPRVDEIW